MKRESKQKQLMRAAGFVEDPSWGVVRVWVRGDLQIALGLRQQISLETLVGYVADQAIYNACKGARIKFTPVNYEPHRSTRES